jgi:hypothetical protein
VPATHRVIAVADALGQPPELDEKNNAAASASLPVTAYRPDLTITALTVPATAQPGRPLAITHTVRNAGPAPAGALAIRFYLSGDDTFDAGDVLLGTRRRRRIEPAGGAETRRTGWRCPPRWPRPHLPDLLITAVSVPATVRIGGTLAITHTVRNAGPAFIVPSTVAPGAHRIIAVADALGQQAELDEAADIAASGVVTVAP